MRLNETIRLYTMWGRNRYADRTLKVYCENLMAFSSYVGNKNIEEITLLSDVLGYLSYMEKKGRSIQTRNLHATSIRQLYKTLEALQKELGLDLPFSAQMIPIKRGGLSRSHLPIPEKHYLSLLAAVKNKFQRPTLRSHRDELILRLLYDTGVRVSELTSMDVEDVDFANGMIQVITKKRKDMLRRRQVFFTNSTADLLYAYLNVRRRIKGLKALFLNDREQGRLTTRSVQRIVRDLCRSAGLENERITPHSFRHALGKRASQNHFDPRLLQKLMGHINMNSTNVYLNLTSSDTKMEYHARLGNCKKMGISEKINLMMSSSS